MRVVFLLCRVAREMVWFGHFLHPVLQWVWRRLGLLWHCFTKLCFRVLGFLTWRNDTGNEPGTSDPNTRAGPAEDVENCRDVGQHEAAGAKWVKCEEEQDEFDSEEYRIEITDELYCCYDSTWETEQSEEDSFRRIGPPVINRYYKFSRFMCAARDMQNYRHDYPSQARTQHLKRQATDDKPNLKFYLGQTPSKPDGVYIKEFHKEWHGEYDALEYVHTYIQWLFPLQEPGMNAQASPLTKEEVKDFRKNATAKENLRKSYELMLDFYGIQLCDIKTGEVKRANNWRGRFKNLNSHTHNNLRITRILKCLGTLGYRHYQAPLVRFFLEETLVNGELPNVKDSVLSYFLFAVLDKRERRDLIKFAYLNYDCKEEFVWCPKKIQMLWSGLSEPNDNVCDIKHSVWDSSLDAEDEGQEAEEPAKSE